MNILQIISGRDINGAVTYCKFVCKELLKSGHQLSIMMRSGCWLKDELPASLLTVECELRRSVSQLRASAQWVRDNQIDIIHTHMTSAHSYGVLLSQMTGVPVVATAHNRSFEFHWRFNDYVIANSNATRDYHRRVNRIRNHKIETVYCFTDLAPYRYVDADRRQKIRQELGLADNEIAAGIVGSICRRKGHQDLANALPKIVEKVPGFRLVVVGANLRGRSHSDRVKTILRRHNVEDRVHWLGVRSDVPSLMSAFDMLIVPSREEPLGLVAIEALAAGTPVVATRVGGLPEVVEDNVSGRLVPPRSPGQLADAVVQLAKNAPQRQLFGATGREIVHERFDPSKLVSRVEHVYEEVVARRRTTKRQTAKRRAA